MGTFIQCAAFVDALALAYSPYGKLPDGQKVRDGARGMWKRFVDAYFAPDYAPVADAYHGFRSLLLHNFSASEGFGFTHDETGRNLAEEGGRVILNRGSFVEAVEEAFDKFQRDVLADDALGERVLKWLDAHPPVGFWVPVVPHPLMREVAGAHALTGTSFSTTSALALSATGTPPSDPAGWLRSADQPRSAPIAAIPKARPKKGKKPKRGKK